MAVKARKKKTKLEFFKMQKLPLPFSLSLKFLQRKKKFNKWYRSHSVNTHNLLKNQSQFTQKPTKFTQSMNGKYTQSEN